MSSIKQPPTEAAQRVSASDLYRAAFERLKNDEPQRLPKGTPISQNNVAKEAGSDPSALKKSRFPTLIAEIQKYVEAHLDDRPESAHQVRVSARKKNRSLRERMENVVQQRDHLASLLTEADATILELLDRVAELERTLPSPNVVPLGQRKKDR
ncbi:hypothetical protein [Pseudomonas chlororaphis]|uniref:Uncharacterized protein n=1 Tax=Pseudomonas chlororaphis O6 TaxID=1037915 RepID=A0AB33WUV8_9PSED|nr:hypothetical protein [Pseudomonas chlororaphis]EIM16993.1 hypothetical protein PchlO6_6038 [Pseudomonas chlororaphis O6]